MPKYETGRSSAENGLEGSEYDTSYDRVNGWNSKGLKGKRGYHSLTALLVQLAHSESHTKANLVHICVPISRGFLHV